MNNILCKRKLKLMSQNMNFLEGLSSFMCGLKQTQDFIKRTSNKSNMVAVV